MKKKHQRRILQEIIDIAEAIHQKIPQADRYTESYHWESGRIVGMKHMLALVKQIVGTNEREEDREAQSPPPHIHVSYVPINLDGLADTLAAGIDKWPNDEPDDAVQDYALSEEAAMEICVAMEAYQEAFKKMQDSIAAENDPDVTGGQDHG